MRKMTLPVLISSLSFVILAACQNSDRIEELAYVERPVETLYQRATDELDSRDYEQAILLFNEVERQHPYSEWARRSALMSAFASYESRRYDDAIDTANRYLALNPASQGAPYAYYLIAVSYFDQIIDVGRDQKTTELAQAALFELVRRYPDTDYARDARLKLDMVDDHLAGKEMEIGRWYLRNNQPLSALNRFRNVVRDYDTTLHAEEALHRLVETYLSLGLRHEAVSAAAVLGYNYPQSEWYADSYSLLQGEGLNPDDLSEQGRLEWVRGLVPNFN